MRALFQENRGEVGHKRLPFHSHPFYFPLIPLSFLLRTLTRISFRITSYCPHGKSHNIRVQQTSFICNEGISLRYETRHFYVIFVYLGRFLFVHKMISKPRAKPETRLIGSKPINIRLTTTLSVSTHDK